MSSGSAHGLSLLCLALALGCSAPQQRYAAYEPYLVRFELDTLGHPESVEAWYACFETEDVEGRKLCLGGVLGVGVDAGHGAICAEPGEPATLCRQFPYSTPDRVAIEGEGEEDSGVVGAVAEGFFEVLGHLLVSTFEGEDDEEHEVEEEERPRAEPRAVSKRSRSRDRHHTFSKPAPRREYHTKPPRKR